MSEFLQLLLDHELTMSCIKRDGKFVVVLRDFRDRYGWYWATEYDTDQETLEQFIQCSLLPSIAAIEDKRRCP